MKYFGAIILSVIVWFSAGVRPVHAEAVAKIAGTSPQCMKEQVSINVNYNLKGKSFDDIKKLIDEQNAKIEEYARQQKLTKFDLQNKNYNISASPSSYDENNNPQSFQYNGNGNVSYSLENIDVAFKFSQFLVGHKMIVSLNSNTYNDGNCGMTQRLE